MAAQTERRVDGTAERDKDRQDRDGDSMVALSEQRNRDCVKHCIRRLV